ncbi:hypothetical protein CspeluHIS016_0208060 [Cutaneotrichosporon spelunceum]|uniref:serine--tRNA ligase n=1 Tax=Cutaneotrichosporon spelunceum TaxID=1672016 RepID=A0AAD3TSS4_9TREE|nr:hypothetical protein CspeluHIS016_0208060 [Cutaneotrichosporon spelunceum]
MILFSARTRKLARPFLSVRRGVASGAPGKVQPSASSHNPAPPSSSLPRARLDYAHLLADPAATARNAAERGLTADVEGLQAARAHALEVEKALNAARAEQGALSSLFKGGKKGKGKGDKGKAIKGDGDKDKSKAEGDTEKQAAMAAARAAKERVQALERAARAADEAAFALASSLPNFTHPASPRGPEENALEIDRFGPPPSGADTARDHVEIARAFGWLDGAASALATGSSWPYLRGPFAQLEHALVGYALSRAIAAGFETVATPDVVLADVAARCGFQPRDGDGGPRQTYFLEREGGEAALCLAGTAEIPLAAMFANRVVEPARVVGVGRAFRAEAGARGADTRGLYRVHQFTKVELFAVARPQDSEGVMEDMRALQKDIALGLGLSVRVLDMPSEELGASAARKYDMEAWMPGRGKWGEITSTSNCTDYQSRRLLIRYRDEEGMRFPHTLNGTAAAVPRLIVALVENGARFRDGKVVGVDLPRALRPFWVGPEALEGEHREGAWDGVIRFV